MEKERHEREWLKMKEAMEKDAALSAQAMEAVQEERLSLKDREHELEMEKRELHALRLRLQSDAASHIQVHTADEYGSTSLEYRRRKMC